MFESHETENAFLIELKKGHNIDNDSFEVEMNFRLIDVHNPHYNHLKQRSLGTAERSAYQIFIAGMEWAYYIYSILRVKCGVCRYCMSGWCITIAY